MAKGKGEAKEWDAATQTWPTNPAQTLIPDLWQWNGEAYQVQQSVDVPTDGKKKNPKLSEKSVEGVLVCVCVGGGGTESAQWSRSALVREPSSLPPNFTTDTGDEHAAKHQTIAQHTSVEGLWH